MCAFYPIGGVICQITKKTVKKAILMPKAQISRSKNKIIKTYLKTDLVVDEAGISFVDSRGFVMNTYALVCAAVPMLVGTPVV